MPSHINRPIDHMFRAGQISGKEWKKLSGKTQGWGSSHKMKSKMATFEHKTRDEAGVHQTGHPIGDRRHIDGPDQGDSAAGFPRPSRGGFVQGGGAEVTNRELDAPSRQQPMFPKQGSGRAPAASHKGPPLRHQRPATTNQRTRSFTHGDEPHRRARPQRV